MAGRPKIKRRKRFFIGCEGESEQGYVALVQTLANNAGLNVHIVAKTMNAGDPLKMAQRAVATIKQQEGGSRPKFIGRFLLFDIDLIGQNPARDAEMVRIADSAGLTLIQQDVCFESCLLRHLKGHENDHPTSSADALTRLKRVWPQYNKGISAQDLARRIQLEDAQKAAQNPLNSDFKVLLEALGFKF